MTSEDTTTDVLTIENYFKSFPNIKLNTRLYVAVGAFKNVKFFDVYRKVPGKDLSIKEVCGPMKDF